MTKKLPLSLAFLAMSSVSFAQSIDFSNYSFPQAQVDRFLVGATGNLSLASTGNNQTWNYGNVVNVGTDSIHYYSAQDSLNGYPAVYNFVERNLVSPTGATINAFRFYNISQSGFYSAAFYTEAFSESLAAFTGGASDMLQVPAQRFTFADSLFYLKFPVTSGNTWTTSQDRIVNYNLSLAGFGLNNTPGYFKATETHTRTVVGDGTIIIPDESGNPMPPVPVLMISINQSITDSVYLAGQPAPSALLSAFGLSQGTVVNSSYVLFYALTNPSLPIVGYNLDAAGNIAYFYYRPSEVRRALNIGLNENTAELFNAYPNPIKSGQTLQLSLLEDGLTNAYVLSSLSGQIVQSGECNALNSSIKLNEGIEAGIYILSLKDRQGQLIQRTKLHVL